ncbi:helix-turn-helix domain-containing protein [Finegoldia magna]|uniref:Transposase n=1 Tax=Finegoldia magna ATCC 53516 TaxID=525282 RepID=D6S8H6_FINMA|nr:helix-turn-helix domain-containing protein [Finegoldia magna]EFH93104.1 transposase [Finegoldia magna ATCC 53516]
MPKYRTEFKVKVVKEYLKSSISYKYLSEKHCIPDKILAIRWVNDFRKQGIEGLKPKKRGRPSKMPKSTNKSKDIKVYSSEKLTNLEDNSLTQAQLKEKIKKLEEKNYWLQLENDAIKKKIEFSQMTDAEIRQLLKQSGF